MSIIDYIILGGCTCGIWSLAIFLNFVKEN